MNQNSSYPKEISLASLSWQGCYLAVFVVVNGRKNSKNAQPQKRKNAQTCPASPVAIVADVKDGHDLSGVILRRHDVRLGWRMTHVFKMAKMVDLIRQGALGLLLALMFSAFAPASAQMISAMTAEEVKQALTEAGMSSVQIEDVASGAPVFRADMGEVLFFVRALDCAENACSTLMFFANFELGRNAVSTDYSIVNQYNERQVFGRAYVIDERGEVGVDYVIELGGGVSKENVAVNISTWGDVINAFREHFRSRAAGS